MLKVGSAYLIRTSSYFILGRLKAIEGSFALFEDASWVANTGRFGECLSDGKIEESERFPGEVVFNLAQMIDAAEWTHKLPESSI